jgi:hypothetical protein
MLCDERLEVKTDGSTLLQYTGPSYLSSILSDTRVKLLLIICNRMKKGEGQRKKKKCHTKTVRGKIFF